MLLNRSRLTRVYLQEFRQGIPCIVVANKIDLDLKVLTRVANKIHTHTHTHTHMAMCCWQVTKKSFNFAAKRNLPFYFVSASEGTNVVKVFKEAIESGHKYLLNPPSDDLYAEIKDLGLLDDD